MHGTSVASIGRLICLTITCGLMMVSLASAGDAELARLQIGYTELRTNLPGNRHSNVRTSRAVISQADGGQKKLVASELIDDSNEWTQFAGWSPDGHFAIVNQGWQDPANAVWEEEHRTFRMEPGKWKLDNCLVNLETGKIKNVTEIERVSHYNGGLFFLPEGKGMGFSPLIEGKSKSYLMDLDGRNKRDVTGDDSGFAYGYSASPQGDRISYHENYQIYLSNTDGSDKKHIDTGNPFNFGPRWSPDGEWLLFLSGEHYHSNPYLVRRDGTELKKLVDLGGYESHILFLDVFDFHQGSSDLPVWSIDGKSVFYTALVGDNVELFQVTLDGNVTRLTDTAPGTLHYHPTPSPDGNWLLYGSKRQNVRQLFVMRLRGQEEFQVTNLKEGSAAMWAHWRPISGEGTK